MRSVLVLSLLYLVACEKPPRGKTEFSNFKAKTEGALAVELDGTAQFWCVTRPMKMCGVHFLPMGDGADSINFTVTNSARPLVGRYPLDPDLDPSGRNMRANYLSGRKGGQENYVARRGELVITESNNHVLRGTFLFDGQGVEPVNRRYPEVLVRGEFTAECDLQLRAAYTCD